MGRQRVRLHYDTKDDDVAPFLATFRGGPLPPTEDLSKFGFQMYQHVNKKQRLVVASTDRVAYQAANFGYMSNLNDSANYVLGVFDKTTKSVRLIDVPQVYVMQQTIKNINDQQDSEDETEDLQKTKETREKRRQELVDKFGSKKSQRIVKSRMENRLQAENVSGGQAIASTLHMRIQEAEQKAPTALNANQLNALLPPCNMDATVPEKVYALSNILDHANIESLKVKAHEYEKVLSSNIASGINSERFGIFATRVISSWNSETCSEDVKFLGFVYYTALYRFYQLKFPLHRASCKTLSEEHDISIALMRHLLSTFAEVKHEPDGPTTYLQAKTHKDKLLLYILIMALTMNNYTVQLAELASDLKKSPLTLANHCRQIGCHIEKMPSDTSLNRGVYQNTSLKSKKGGSAQCAVLSIPLQFPAAKGGKKRN